MHTAIAAKLINITAAVLTGIALLFGANSAHAANKIVARVSLSQQVMEVSVDGRPTFAWKVSTGDRAHVTPTGSFRPTRMHEMWHSKKYDNAPMPHSVFFSGGYAVHATYANQASRAAGLAWLRALASRCRRRFLSVGRDLRANTSIVIVK